MTAFSTIYLLDNDYTVVERKNFEGTEYLVTPIFAGYSMTYLQRNLFEETSYEYLESLTNIMKPEDVKVKNFFDEEVLELAEAIKALKQLVANYSFPKETFLRLNGYLQFMENTDATYVVQQNSNVYPDVDNKIKGNKYQK
ncbi:hypothetical protein G7081_05580 [Vagococcus coleopterorum]|uniref:Uncharacterized protein n=1 Tax=Vagococcus coleopterorum TaxID=2714946 RepID=A0A6G8ANT5_9ENTE|nr:hypothetical protein [Vagococcus coleopterorum]QIL46583.1 hypothetical protein G7081_05580 [Vagococcus coleopterorum]